MAQDHSLTGELVLRSAWSEADGALKMIPSSNTSFAIELSAADGDSVTVVQTSSVVDQASGEVSCVGMKTLCLYGAGTVEISPDDSAGTWYTITPTALTPANLCARRIRITGAGKLVIQSV